MPYEPPPEYFDKGTLYIPYMVLKLENKDGKDIAFVKVNGKIETHKTVDDYLIEIYNDYRKKYETTHAFRVKEFEYKIYGRDIV